MDVAAMARAAGLTVLLDGRIGRQEYQSVSGSLAALRRFGEAFNAPVDSDVGRVEERLRNRAARQIDDTDAQLMRDAAGLLRGLAALLVVVDALEISEDGS